MKIKNPFILLFFAVVLLLVSCSVNSTVLMHRDKTMSLNMEVNFKEMLSFINLANDSTNTKPSKQPEFLANIPKEWMNYYDIQKRDGNRVPLDEDSIKLMKKFLIKAKIDGDKVDGLSMKINQFTGKEYPTIANIVAKGRDFKIPMNNLFKDWNGKKLILNTEDFKVDEIKKMISDNDETHSQRDMNELLSFMLIYTITIQFEKDIKTISGKHDWLNQIDKRTLHIKFDTSNLDGNQPFTNKDSKIVIETE